MIIEFSLLDHLHGQSAEVLHLFIPGLLALLGQFGNCQTVGLGSQVVILLHGVKIGLGQFGGHVRNIVQVSKLI